METIALPVTQNAYPTAKSARIADRVPMVYYGKGVTNLNFSADYQDFRRAYQKGGRSTIITLVNEEEKKFPAIVHEIQYHPVTDRVIHVDVIAVDMNKPITTQIPLKFTGVALAVKDLGGVFVRNRDFVKIKCLPKDLVHEIEVDISPLTDFSKSLTVVNITAPAGITILDAPTVNIATVAAPRDIEAEEAAMKAEDESLKVAAAAKAAAIEAGVEPTAPGAAAPAEGAEAKAEEPAGKAAKAEKE